MKIAVIGSRDVYYRHINQFKKLVEDYAPPGFIAISGNAEGSDQVSKLFENNKQFLPWRGYNKHLGEGLNYYVVGDNKKFDKLITAMFPWLVGKRESLWRLVRRSFFTISDDNDEPVDAVFYWAPEKNGRVLGGTAYAVEYAKYLGIPCFNVKTIIENDMRYNEYYFNVELEDLSENPIRKFSKTAGFERAFSQEDAERKALIRLGERFPNHKITLSVAKIY